MMDTIHDSQVYFKIIIIHISNVIAVNNYKKKTFYTITTKKSQHTTSNFIHINNYKIKTSETENSDIA